MARDLLACCLLTIHVVNSTLLSRSNMPPYVIKKGGGVRQRMGYDQKKKQQSISSTEDADGVIKQMFKQGRSSAKDVQKISSAIASALPSESSSSSSSGLVDWVRAGSGGANEANLSRDIISKMGKDSGYPDLYATECFFWDEDAQAQVKDDIHI